MRFWDSSALVPLLIDQPASRALIRRYREESVQAVWCLTEIECVSAIARAERDGAFVSDDAAEQALERLAELRERWQEVQPTAELRGTATRLLRVHPLCASDALQLAAAFMCAERRPRTLSFVCLDRRLSDAARREGFRCLP